MRSRAACLVVAPVMLLITTLVAPSNEDDAARQLAVVAAHQSRWFAADTLVLVSLSLLVGAVLGLLRITPGRLATAGGACALMGIPLVAVSSGFGFVEWQMVRGGADRGQMAALLSRVEDAGLVQPVVFAGGLLFAGLVLLAVAAHRSGRLAAYAAAALAGGAVLTALGYAVSNDALPVAGAALLVVALAPVGRHEWRAAQAAAISS
jgi:hypothetical protein